MVLSIKRQAQSFPFKYSYALPFKNGLAWVCISDEDGTLAWFSPKTKWGCINKLGEVIIPLQNFAKPKPFSEGFSAVRLLKGNDVTLYCYINKKGELITNPKFKFAMDFSEGLAAAAIDEKFGFINTKGVFVIAPKFDDAWDFKGGLANVKIGESNAYIDKTGKIWNPQNLQIDKQIIPEDENTGFKSIKIGDNQSKYSGSLNLINTNKSASTYQFTPHDDDLYNLFDLRINKIALSFDNNQHLVEITLIKSYSGSNSLQDAFADASKIDPNLINLFGKQTGIIDINTTTELKLGRVWKTNNVTVKSYAEDYGMNNGTDLKITITDNNFIQQTIKSGF